MGFQILGHDQQSARELVEAVNDAGTQSVASLKGPRWYSSAFTRVPVRTPASSMANQAGGFVNYRQVLIFINQLEGNILRLRPWLGRCRHHLHGNGVSRPQQVAGLDLRMVDLDVAAADPSLDL